MKISICIPCYNQADFIEQAVKSALNQILQPYEIIVSDDHSTDKTSEILERLKHEVKNLKVFRQPKNLGIAMNTDFCLRVAEGEFIVRLDSDDYISSEFCKVLAQKLEKYPNAGYAHAAVKEIDKNNNLQKIRKLYRKPGFENADNALQAAIKGYRVAANIIMFRKSALIDVNYVTGRPEYVEDYHLSVSMAAAGYGNIYSDQVLSSYRVWTDSGMIRQKRKLAEIVGLRKVFEEVLEPEYFLKGWRTKMLLKSKEIFACNQAECLSWPVYNKLEKDEIEKELYKLSSTQKVRVFIKMYRNGMGKPLLSFKRIISFTKFKIKSFLN